MLSDKTVTDSFTAWANEVEPRVRRALTASFGPQVAVEATAEAMSIVWEKWDEVRRSDNPAGYLYGVGRNRARRLSRTRRPDFYEVPEGRLPHVEPGLPSALASLPERQRVTVALVHGYGWTLSEVAELLGIAKTSVQNHAERGLARLRNALGVES